MGSIRGYGGRRKHSKSSSRFGFTTVGIRPPAWQKKNKNYSLASSFGLGRFMVSEQDRVGERDLLRIGQYGSAVLVSH